VGPVSTAGELPQLDASVVTAKVGDTAYVLTLKGELDLYSTPLLTTELEALTPEGPQVVLDLAAVTFLDSTALGAILLAVRRLRQADGDLAIASPNPTTTRLLSIVGVDRVVPVYDTVAQALGRSA
jgi:anti-sigma B factor antagonist